MPTNAKKPIVVRSTPSTVSQACSVPADSASGSPLARPSNSIAAMRVNGIACWPASAYEAPLRRRRLLGRTRFTVSDPDLVRRVLVNEVEAVVSRYAVGVAQPAMNAVGEGADVLR